MYKQVEKEGTRDGVEEYYIQADVIYKQTPYKKSVS